jgi:hypothetical protein
MHMEQMAVVLFYFIFWIPIQLLIPRLISYALLIPLSGLVFTLQAFGIFLGFCPSLILRMGKPSTDRQSFAKRSSSSPNYHVTEHRCYQNEELTLQIGPGQTLKSGQVEAPTARIHCVGFA